MPKIKVPLHRLRLGPYSWLATVWFHYVIPWQEIEKENTCVFTIKTLIPLYGAMSRSHGSYFFLVSSFKCHACGWRFILWMYEEGNKIWSQNIDPSTPNSFLYIFKVHLLLPLSLYLHFLQYKLACPIMT